MAVEFSLGQDGSDGQAADGAALVRDVESFTRRFVILPRHASLPVALWIMATHLFDAFELFPYLALLSPEKGCGKTRTTKIIELLASNPQSAVCPSEAALFRLIQDKSPTLILDEAEILTGRGERADAVRAILNAGNCVDATVPRCVGQSHEVRFFSVYCPKVVCAIRVCPETVKDRSIVIPMQRKRHDECVAKFIRRRVRPGAESLKSRIVAWCERNKGEIEETYEALEVDFLSDRDLENTRVIIGDFSISCTCDRGSMSRPGKSTETRVNTGLSCLSRIKATPGLRCQRRCSPCLAPPEARALVGDEQSCNLFRCELRHPG